MTSDFYRNIKDIRRWVLLEQGFCEDQRRHILFNRRGHFLGYISNGTNQQETQAKLNRQRRRLAELGRTALWSEGGRGTTGYPFALACNQPHVQMDEALERMTGKHDKDRFWGSWLDIKVGSASNPVSLIEAVVTIYHHRTRTNKFDDHILRDILGQILIESGARKMSRSKANAVGLMQLMPAVIRDCQIPDSFAEHRIAQIDCALKLHHQNDRNLAPLFEQRFGHLPPQKKAKLYAMLLIQAYHGGLGRISNLLQADRDAGSATVKTDAITRAAAFFAEHHERFSAEEIALGLIFHNLGRNNLGLASLYYLVDVEIASDALCSKSMTRKQGFC